MPYIIGLFCGENKTVHCKTHSMEEAGSAVRVAPSQYLAILV